MVLPEFLIMLREGFEAALLVSIVIAYLKRINRQYFIKYVWYGVYLAVVLSVVIGTMTWVLYGALKGAAKLLFEGIAAWLAVVVLSSVIVWMARKGSTLRQEIEHRVEVVSSKGAIFGLTAFAFTMVFREGIESILFLTPFIVRNPFTSSLSSFLGAVIAVVIAYTVFFLGMKLSLKKFFYTTSILLIFIASGLAGYGTHEFIEYAEEININLGWFAETAYTLPISEENLLHQNNVIGSILSVLFGYTIKAETGRLLLQMTYLTIAIPLVIKTYRKIDTKNNIPTHGPGGT